MLSALSLTAFAQDKKTVAVLDPICRDNTVNAFFQQMVRGAMESAVTNSLEYEAYDRSAFDLIQKEQAFQRTGAVNDTQIKKMGELAGVDYVLVSEVSAYDGYLSAVIKILNVTTGKYDKSVDDYSLLNPESVKNKCKEMASSLFGTISSNGVSRPIINQKKSGQDYIETAFDINMKMVWVEGGEFLMGCTSEQSDCGDDEKNVRRVTVDGFYIGMLEVTQAQWEAVMGTSVYQQWSKAYGVSPTSGVGAGHPMCCVSWDEAMEFCRLLSNKTGKTYTLPTEAQWEYAARGGNRPDGTKYAGSNMIDAVAWYYDNSGNTTHPCGKKRANALGLYDMSGNVYEWCKDWYSDYMSYDTNNPIGLSSGSRRVRRGGGWRDNAQRCRVALRSHASPGARDSCIGFRVVCIP